MVQKEVLRKSVIPYYAAGFSWLIYSFILPLYRLVDFVILGVLSMAVFLLFQKMFPGERVLVDVVAQPVRSGNVQLDQMISEGRDHLRKIRKVNNNIKEPGISNQITRIEEISDKIFLFILENPQKTPAIRKFFNYYLPTVLKLLTSYDTMGRQTVQGTNIKSTMEGVEEIMATVVVAFENQLDRLFQDEALDISTDITVLEGMLAQEGLTGRDFIK